MEAIWMKSPSEVDDAKYNEFYKFIAKAYDTPLAKVRALQYAVSDIVAAHACLSVKLALYWLLS